MKTPEWLTDLRERTKDAMLNRLWIHTVGVVNTIRTVGVDPSTGQPGDSEEPGTGLAARWGEHNFILTARHVLEGAEPNNLKFFCYPEGGMKYRGPADMRLQDTVEAVSMSEQQAVIHRCDWEDLALMTTIPKAVGKHTEFFEIANRWIDPPEGEIVHCFGFPFDKGVLVDRRRVGPKEERGVALYASVFSADVLPLPTEDERKFKMPDFDPERHYLIPFADATVGRHPRGYSGAAVWWESDESQVVWAPNFKFAGICTCCYKKGSVEQVVKASVVRRFVEEVFGPA
jgi:hypothetical protein